MTARCALRLITQFAFATLERFPEKWPPVFVNKARQSKELEPRPDSTGPEKALTASRNGSARPRGRWLTAALLPVLIFSYAPNVLAKTEYSFAPVPQYEHRKLFSIWKPIIDELQRRTEINFKLVIVFSVPEMERGVLHGDYDFTYVNPGHFMRALSHQDYVPLVSDTVALRAIVVVAKDSSIQKPEELGGMLMAVPSRNAFGSSLAIQSQLLSRYGVRIRVTAVNTHTSVYLHVANKLVEAGGGNEKTLSVQPKSIRDNLRVVFKTDELPSHPVVAHSRVPQEVREKVRAAFIEMAKTPEGAALLARIPMNGVRPVTLDDYSTVEKFEDFWVEGE